MIRRFFLVGLFSSLLGAAALMEGCDRAPAQAGGAMPPPMVTTAPVVERDVPEYLDEIGKTSASEVVNIVPQVSGKIIKRLFDDGTDLKTGQKLFLIDPRPYQAALDQASAMVEQYQAQWNNSKTNFSRIADELPSKAVSQQDYDNGKNTVDVAEANVKMGQAAVETARLNLEYCTITSPLDGRAGQRLVDVGNVVTANSGTLLVIEKLSPIYVDFTIPETELARVRKCLAQGPLKVSVQAPTDPNTSVTGEVTFLDNSVQDGTGTIKLRATFENENRQLWPGQFVHVTLILATLHNALLVPAEAIQIGQQGQFVYLFNTDPATHTSTADQVFITLGQKQGDETVASKGLEPGQTVIRSGQLMVQPSGPVMLAMPMPGPGAEPGAAAGGGKP
jgi:multidrug efflux system membrane fusion protein